MKKKIKGQIKENVNKLDDCISCQGKCCKHVALEIDTPTCKRDYDNIRWYLMHENIYVFKDEDGSWTLEFLTKCKNLNEDFMCSIYQKRPKLCREYPGKDLRCEYIGDDLPYEKLFTCPEDLEQYLENRNIDWKWKKL